MTPDGERQQIYAHIVEQRPDLARRIQFGPSGALVVAVGPGRSVEVGRMRRRGRARWVVVSPAADRAQVREPVSTSAVARAAIAEIDAAASLRPSTVWERRPCLLASPT